MNDRKAPVSRSVASRLAASFAIVLSMMLALTVLSIAKVNSIETSLDTISSENNVKQRYAVNFRGSVHDRAIALRDLTLVGDAEVDGIVALINRLDGDYQASAQRLDAIFSAGSTHAVRPEERQHLAQIKAMEARAMPIARNAAAQRATGKTEEARQTVLREGRPAFVDWLASINAFIDLEERMSQDESARARGLAHGFQASMVTLLLAALATGAVLAALITRQLGRALGAEPDEVKAVAQAVTRGELYHAVRLRRHDGAGASRGNSIMATLADMSASLRGTVASVRNATHDLVDVGAQIAEGNRYLASRTEEQASSLEETASAMEQLTATVRQNDDHARQVNLLAQKASDIAVEGRAIVGEVVTTMASIDESSRRIVDIIGVIEGIAFQTNILALNAAVEAARAGEQGRGFAVVATEVRSLAQRSSSAAKEVKQLIDNSVAKVATGTRLVQQAGSTMEQIVGSVQHVTGVMGEIASASHEQSQGIEEVNRAIALMDQVTVQNAVLVEQAGASVQRLQDQAERLADAVGAFQLEESPSAAAPDRAVPHAAGVRMRGAPAQVALPRSRPGPGLGLGKEQAYA